MYMESEPQKSQVVHTYTVYVPCIHIHAQNKQSYLLTLLKSRHVLYVSSKARTRGWARVWECTVLYCTKCICVCAQTIRTVRSTGKLTQYSVEIVRRGEGGRGYRH